VDSHGTTMHRRPRRRESRGCGGYRAGPTRGAGGSRRQSLSHGAEAARGVASLSMPNGISPRSFREIVRAIRRRKVRVRRNSSGEPYCDPGYRRGRRLRRNVRAQFPPQS
jgi:hypothetical protein